VYAKQRVAATSVNPRNEKGPENRPFLECLLRKWFPQPRWHRQIPDKSAFVEAASAVLQLYIE
jgi:hypothetical protein